MRNLFSRCCMRTASPLSRRGFTLIELLVVIAINVCPGEVNDRGKTNAAGAVVHWCLNYAVNQGRWLVLDPATGQGGDGAFGPNRGFGPADFPDGLSHTLAAAEVKAFTPQLR